MNDYNKWLSNDCCCGGYNNNCTAHTEVCDCENILLEISNLKTTDNVISGEVAEKQDKLIAGDNITISGNVISAVGGEGISSGDVQTMIENNLDGYATEQWVEDKHYITGVDLSNYATLQDIPTVPSNVSAFLNDAHYVTNSELMQYIANLQNQIDSLIASVSGCCSSTGETQYRWVTMTDENDYWCSGTTKMSMEKEQSSTDGLVWTDVSPEATRSGSTVLEENCEDCGYIPSYGTKLTATFNNGNTQVINCAGIPEDDFVYKRDFEDLETGPSGLTEAVVGSCPTLIGGYCFSGCTSLSSVTIPDNITAIGAWSFYECDSLTSIVIPSGVTSINQGAFSVCYNLVNFTCLATTPPALSDQQFIHSKILIYVPAASVEAYKAARNWREYADKIYPIQ